MIKRYVHLITAECGDYHTQPVTVRVYLNKHDADTFMEKLAKYYARKPTEPECKYGQDQAAFDAEHDRWWKKLQAWEKRHPAGKDWGSSYREADEWKCERMELR